jgi:hypothetical protein
MQLEAKTLESHKRSSKNYEGKVLSNVDKKFSCILLKDHQKIITNPNLPKYCSINKSDEVIGPEQPCIPEDKVILFFLSYF